MSNVIELSFNEIDTVVGGVKLAAAQQATVSQSTATMVHVPNKIPNGSMLAGTTDISALLARMEARR